jgi:hypothetical protein
VNVTMRGAISLGARDALDALLADYAQRLVYLRSDLSRLQTQPTEPDLARLSAEGFMAEALGRLRNSPDPAAADAIRLLYRLQREAASASD